MANIRTFLRDSYRDPWHGGYAAHDPNQGNEHTAPWTHWVDFSRDTTDTAALQFRLNARRPAPVTEDLFGGLTMLDVSLIGKTREATVGADVVVNASASHACMLRIDEAASAEDVGASISGQRLFPIPSGETIGVRFQATQPFYRAVIVCREDLAVSRVQVFSQVRDIDL